MEENKRTAMDVIEHHGILGMKWGVRRYQNADGTLTESGKKHYSKEYKKYASKATNDYQKSSQKIYVDAYNKSAREQNENMAKKDKNKYSVDEWNKMWEDSFQELFDKNYADAKLQFFENNDNYKKAIEIADNFGLIKYDELAKDNADFIKELRAMVKK